MLGSNQKEKALFAVILPQQGSGVDDSQSRLVFSQRSSSQCPGFPRAAVRQCQGEVKGQPEWRHQIPMQNAVWGQSWALWAGLLTRSSQKPSWHLGWVLLGLGGWGFVNCSGVPLSVRPRSARSKENSPKNSGVGSHCNGWSCFTSPEIQVGALNI